MAAAGTWLDKVIAPTLTGVIIYQFIYNLQGAVELGGKYTNALHLSYSLGSLIPALLLGIYASRLAWARSEDRLSAMLKKSSRCYIVFARMYLALVGIGLGFAIISGYVASFFDQLEVQYIVSFHRAMRFMDYYWVNL